MYTNKHNTFKKYEHVIAEIFAKRRYQTKENKQNSSKYQSEL